MEFDHSAVQLGKAQYVHDERSLMMAKFVLPAVHTPERFDFDHDRYPFANPMWGNDHYGDCVIATESAHILRLQRIESRRTPKVFSSDAIARYLKLTGGQDNGLEIIMAMRDWHNSGYDTAYKNRNYKIAAYGELDPEDGLQLRTSCYLLHGIHFGFWLPTAAQAMTRNGIWDYQGQTGPEWQPGSWGGHCVYSKKFDPDSMSVLTWGREVQVSNSFIQKYADEAWAVVDSLDPWRKSDMILDVSRLEKELAQITSKVNQ